MMNMVLQKSASNELWWIGGAFTLFLALGIGVTLFHTIQRLWRRLRTSGLR